MTRPILNGAKGVAGTAPSASRDSEIDALVFNAPIVVASNSPETSHRFRDLLLSVGHLRVETVTTGEAAHRLDHAPTELLLVDLTDVSPSAASDLGTRLALGAGPGVLGLAPSAAGFEPRPPWLREHIALNAPSEVVRLTVATSLLKRLLTRSLVGQRSGPMHPGSQGGPIPTRSISSRVWHTWPSSAWTRPASTPAGSVSCPRLSPHS